MADPFSGKGSNDTSKSTMAGELSGERTCKGDDTPYVWHYCHHS